MNIRLMMAVALMAAALLLCSCSDDEVAAPQDENSSSPGSESPEILMNSFLTAYEDRDSALLLRLLHPRFETSLQEPTTQQFPDLGASLDLTEETRIAQRMMSGQAVVNADGDLISAVTSIAFNIFEQQGGWVTNDPTDPFPNTQAAIFDVQILFDRAGAATLPVQGQIKFTVAKLDTIIAGQTIVYYTMIGQQDLTNFGKKGVEEASWGSVKALYW